MKIKNAIQLLSAIGIWTLLTGCPYTASVPISEAGDRVPSFIKGIWHSESDADYNYEVKAGEGNKVNIAKITIADGSREEYSATFSEINGSLFMSVADVSFGESFYLYKIHTSGNNEMTLYELTENIRESFDGSNALRDFISRNMNNSYFYTTGELTYTRQE